MIRILHVITRMDVGGSTDDVTMTLARLPGAAFAQRLVSGPTLEPPPRLGETLAAAGAPWDTVPSLRRDVHPLADLRALGGVWRAIRRVRPDIVHTHTSKAGFIGRLAARLAGVRRIVHTPHGHIFHGYFTGASTRLFVAMERLATRFTERITVLTDAEAAQHLALGIGRPEQFVTIPSGVDLAEARARAADAPRVRRALGIEGDALLMGTVSRLVPIKGLTHLVAALPEILRRCPQAHLAVAGDGPERSALAAQAGALGVADRVCFLGFREDVPAVVGALDLFVLPSLNEGLGKVLVTAMALGVPVLATKVGGVPEVVEDGRQGLLVPPADPAALAKAAITLLEDRAAAAARGAAGRIRAERFSAEVMLDRLAALYRNDPRPVSQ